MYRKLGVIADDFTGASDAASFLVKAGMRTVLFNGVPEEGGDTPEGQAMVVALKSRTQETGEAVRDTLRAAAWLRAHGADQLYIKYCSTFDSTPEGNIGPILDSLLETYHVAYTVLCPSLPVNGRTVKDGKLFVNGVPLDESPMKNHPLTPMWDSRLAVLMKAQSRYDVLDTGAVTEDRLEEIRDSIRTWSEGREHFYVVPDYETQEDAEAIVKIFGELPILSGGSGLLEVLGKTFSNTGSAAPPDTHTAGAGLLLAGSCSVATRGQIAYMQKKGIPSLRMDPIRLMDGTQTEQELWQFIREHDGEVLIYSSDTPEAVKEAQKYGSGKVSALIEKTTAGLARCAVENGYTRIIVAGGETSGAVTKALGFDSYVISESVAPGVPVMIPGGSPDVRLVLKSGNFGQEDFFERALKMTGEGKDE